MTTIEPHVIRSDQGSWFEAMRQDQQGIRLVQRLMGAGMRSRMLSELFSTMDGLAGHGSNLPVRQFQDVPYDPQDVVRLGWDPQTAKLMVSYVQGRKYTAVTPGSMQHPLDGHQGWLADYNEFVQQAGQYLLFPMPGVTVDPNAVWGDLWAVPWKSTLLTPLILLAADRVLVHGVDFYMLANALVLRHNPRELFPTNKFVAHCRELWAAPASYVAQYDAAPRVQEALLRLRRSDAGVEDLQRFVNTLSGAPLWPADGIVRAVTPVGLGARYTLDSVGQIRDVLIPQDHIYARVGAKARRGAAVASPVRVLQRSEWSTLDWSLGLDVSTFAPFPNLRLPYESMRLLSSVHSGVECVEITSPEFAAFNVWWRDCQVRRGAGAESLWSACGFTDVDQTRYVNLARLVLEANQNRLIICSVSSASLLPLAKAWLTPVAPLTATLIFHVALSSS